MIESRDILLLCSGEDRELAAKLAEIIAAKGLSFSKVETENDLGAMAASASCVICILSKNMEWSPVVKSLVLESLKEKRFVGLRIDDSALPEELQHIQIINLAGKDDYEPWHKLLTAVRKITKRDFQIDDLPTGEPDLKQPFVKKDGQAYMWYGAATTGVWLASEEYRRQREAEAKEKQESVVRNSQAAAPDIVSDPSKPRVFLSYSRRDEAFIADLNRVFESFKLPVWWDDDIPPGEEWANEIRKELGAVNYVLVVWSKNSVLSTWVLLEAQEAYKRGRLLGLRIDDCVIPEPYSRAETIDFVGKSLTVNDPALREFFKRVGELTHSDFWARLEARDDGVVGVL